MGRCPFVYIFCQSMVSCDILNLLFLWMEWCRIYVTWINLALLSLVWGDGIWFSITSPLLWIQVAQKRWRLEINSNQDAVLMLSSVTLPDGIQVTFWCYLLHDRFGVCQLYLSSVCLHEQPSIKCCEDVLWTFVVMKVLSDIHDV